MKTAVAVEVGRSKQFMTVILIWNLSGNIKNNIGKLESSV